MAFHPFFVIATSAEAEGKQPSDMRMPKQSSQKWPFRFCEKTLRKQMNRSRHSLGNQGMSA
jgi:hypothetical protein